MALNYSSNSKYALKVKIAEEYFEKSKQELDEALASGAIDADKHRQQMMTLSNVVNSAKALNLFGDKPGVSSITMTKQDKFDFILITAPENLCWLLNLRGSGSEFSPIANGYLIINGS